MWKYEHEKQVVTLNKISLIVEKNNFKDKCLMGFGLFLGAVRQKKLNTILLISFKRFDKIQKFQLGRVKQV